MSNFENHGSCFSKITMTGTIPRKAYVEKEKNGSWDSNCREKR